jgi:hypothetical protein
MINRLPIDPLPSLTSKSTEGISSSLEQAAYTMRKKISEERKEREWEKFDVRYDGEIYF